VATGQEVRRIVGHPKLVTTAFCPDGRTLASAGWDGTIRLWQAASGQQIHQWRSSGDRVLALAVSPAGRFLVSGEPDCTLSLWELPTGKRLRQFVGGSNYTYALAFSPDGKLLASCSLSHQGVQLWRIATGGPVRRLGNAGTSGYAF